jgi:hypothetical protein
MGSPGYVADNTNSSRPQLFIFHSDLHTVLNFIRFFLQFVGRDGF